MSDIPYNLERFIEKWSLSKVNLLSNDTANLVFACHSFAYGEAVLKIGCHTAKEFDLEYKALSTYSGRGFCRVYEVDLLNKAMLLEWVKPGDTLRKEASLEQRLNVFVRLYRDLHLVAKSNGFYPTYLDWVKKIRDYMHQRYDFKGLSLHMDKAYVLCCDLTKKYDGNMLLHGDLHHGNILKTNDGYCIIDPKGVVGDKIFDLPRFILNEFDEDISDASHDKIQKIISFLSEKLGIPEPVIKQCVYIETAMANCWNVESGATTDAYEKLMAQVDFAECMMKSGSVEV